MIAFLFPTEQHIPAAYLLGQPVQQDVYLVHGQRHQVMRDRFDAWLVAKAGQAGTEVHEGEAIRVARQGDTEVRAIVDRAHEQVRQLLSEQQTALLTPQLAPLAAACSPRAQEA